MCIGNKAITMWAKEREKNKKQNSFELFTNYQT